MAEETLKKKQYQLQKQIREGNFGILQCYHTITNQSYAIKVINRKSVFNESKIMNYLPPHPNIIKIFDSFEDNNFSYLVLELCQTNDLCDHIIKGPLSERIAAYVVKKLLEAIKHCHENGVAHRDIKPDNILFDFDGNVKLADFGYAECFLKDGKKKMLSGGVGTPCYVAPEVIMEKECYYYSEKVDIWSCGVTLYTMLGGTNPFIGKNNDEIFENILKTDLKFPTIFESVSFAAKGLIRMMLCKDASKRLSADQALMHPWILNGGVIKDDDMFGSTFIHRNHRSRTSNMSSITRTRSYKV